MLTSFEITLMPFVLELLRRLTLPDNVTCL